MKNKLKKLGAALISLTMIVQTIPAHPLSAGTDISTTGTLTPIVTKNQDKQRYIANTLADTVKSYLTKTDTGYMRVEYNADYGIIVEYYDNSFHLTSQRTISCELPIFGGFYAGSDEYYVVFGQNNPDEDDSVEVIRVVQYDKNWNRLKAASIKASDTYTPFGGGSLRMTEYNDILYIRTCHRMYADTDRQHHQSNLSMQIKESDMSVLGSIRFMPAGYVSHSFNQFILVDDNSNLVALDHGDGYPRAAVLNKCRNKAGTEETFSRGADEKKAFLFYGGIGVNFTGASLGGFSYSSSHYIIAGSSIIQDGSHYTMSTYNTFITIVDKNAYFGDSITKWISTYEDGGSTTASTPQLVKINDNSFLMLWEVIDMEGNSNDISYVFLDGTGEIVSEIYTREGYLSDCQPILSDDKIIWYVTNEQGLKFYSVDTTGNYQIYNVNSIDSPTVSELPSGSSTPASGNPDVSESSSGGSTPASGNPYVSEPPSGGSTSSKGDIDGNGNITLNDVQLLLKMALSIIPVENVEISDINSDGKINLADARMLLKIALGIPEKNQLH